MSMLASFETDNMTVNTLRLETLASYDGLELAVSVEDALSEMRAVIAPNAADDPAVAQLEALSEVSPTQFLAGQAYGYWGRIFEDIFQGVYCGGLLRAIGRGETRHSLPRREDSRTRVFV